MLRMLTFSGKSGGNSWCLSGSRRVSVNVAGTTNVGGNGVAMFLCFVAVVVVVVAMSVGVR